MAKQAKRKRGSRSDGQCCIDCGEPIASTSWFQFDRKRKGLVGACCGPGKPQMAVPKKKV